MGERVNLDAVMARHVAGSFEESQADVPALVAELRAMRRAGLAVLTGAFASRDFAATLEIPRSLVDDLAQLLTDPDPAAGHAEPEGQS